MSRLGPGGYPVRSRALLVNDDVELTIGPAIVTATGQSIDLATRTEISPTSVVADGQAVLSTLTAPIAPATATAVGQAVTIDLSFIIEAALVEVDGQNIALLFVQLIAIQPTIVEAAGQAITLRALVTPTTRRPLYLRSRGGTPASYWKGVG